jgi:hypothetical protein
MKFSREPNMLMTGDPMSDCLGTWGEHTKPEVPCTDETPCDMCKAWGRVLDDLKQKKDDPAPTEEIPF